MWPHPHTPQYHRGYCQEKIRVPDIPLPSEGVQCEGWGRAWLQHRVDYGKETTADKYMIGPGHEKWYYITTDGWALSFWDENAYDPTFVQKGGIFPDAWFDMRRARISRTSARFTLWLCYCMAEPSPSKYLPRIVPSLETSLVVSRSCLARGFAIVWLNRRHGRGPRGP